MTHLRSRGLAIAIVALSLAGYLPFAPARLYDFRAFYCAGMAITAHTDPYRERSLHVCERTTSVPGMQVDSDDVTVPAPLPGYVLAIFALLSVLPFGISALVWIVALVAALVASVELVRRVVDVPAVTVFVTVGLPAAIVALPLGQTAPIVGCGIALCAYGLTFSRWRLAAAGALATSVDPAIALVLCATLLFAAPATRATILCGTAALAALALLTLGVDVNVEYLRAVLPAHAAGNIAERSQFSATHFAWVAGIGSRAALAIGKLWYAGAALAGGWIAVRLRPKFGIAALAFVPPAFAVFGGLYVHFSQLTLAIPAYLLLMRRSSPKLLWMPAAIFVLAVPWLALTAFPPFAVALVVLGIAYAGELRDTPFGTRLGLGAGALLIVFFAVALVLIRIPASTFHTVVGPDALAEVAWSRYVAWRDAKPNPLFLVLQVPTVVTFTACLAALFWKGVKVDVPAPSAAA
jgi:hypothetical protein